MLGLRRAICADAAVELCYVTLITPGEVGSFTYSPLSPGGPQAPKPEGPLCISQEVLTTVFLACYEMTNLRHTVSDNCCRPKKFPKTLGTLAKSVLTLCGQLGFIKKSLEAATPEGLHQDRADPQVLPFLPPLLDKSPSGNANTGVSHRCFYLQSLPG